MLFRLLNVGGAELPLIRRLWLVPGEPVAVTRRVLMTLMVDREGDEWTPVVRLIAPNAECSIPVPAGQQINLRDWGRTTGEYRDLHIVPRALQLGQDEKPLRLRVELVGEHARAQFVRP